MRPMYDSARAVARANDGSWDSRYTRIEAFDGDGPKEELEAAMEGGGKGATKGNEDAKRVMCGSRVGANDEEDSRLLASGGKNGSEPSDGRESLASFKLVRLVKEEG